MKRFLSCLLCVLILVPALAACASDDPADTTPADTDAADTTTVESASDTAEETEPAYKLNVPSADYENASWNFLTLERQETGKMYQYIDIAWQEELEGDRFNDALYARNLKVEEDYKVVISVTQNANLKGTLTNLVSSGDTTYSAVSLTMNEGLSAGQSNQVYDISDMDALQLDAPWWDEALFRDLSIGSKKFLLTGDISVMDEEMLYVIFCNKKLLKDNNTADPYDLVREGKWTLDKLHELVGTVSKDLNGDGKMDENDIYGYGSDFSTAPLLFYAAGGSIAKCDSDGVPQLVLMSEKNEGIIERIGTFQNDSAVANASKINGSWNTLSTMLMEDRLLFRQGNVYNITGYREMISDFGVLPLPKESESQEDYCHVVATSYATGITIPVTLTEEKLDQSCVILAALSAHSGDVVNEYYEVNLKYKNTRDEASFDMLEIIFESKSYDLGKVFDWGALESGVIKTAIQQPGSFASRYSKVSAKAEKAMNDSYEFFK